MTYHIARGEQRRWVTDPGNSGLRTATLVDGSDGAVHLEVRVCELAAGAGLTAHRHPFEQSWLVEAGHGELEVDGMRYELGEGDYGLVPVASPHRIAARPDESLRWLSVRAPCAPSFAGARSSIPAHLATGVDLGRPSETDPRHRLCGHFEEGDVAPFADLAMPGYHGPQITNISIRMMVDALLGARHHTLFIATLAAHAGPGHAARVHYHPFEEIYYFRTGSMLGHLDGDEVSVGAGDLVWVGVGATHGFVNHQDAPARWVEAQSPVPPDSNAFFFPDDWTELGR